MRVVFDTNIFISALVIPGCQAEKAISRIIFGSDTLMISKAIIEEVLRVLHNKFSRDIEAISHTAVFLSELGELIHKTPMIRIFKDEPDNRILECALGGRADVIVTGDKEILRLKEYEGIKIISLREFLES